jgi:hypothetical protein
MSVSTEYYLETFEGVEFDGLEWLLARAEQMVGCLISSTPAEGTEAERCYKNAVCAQAENMGLSGGVAAWLAEQKAGGSSFSIGSFSMSGSSGSSSGTAGSSRTGVCDGCMMWLEKGGLLYRGIPAL